MAQARLPILFELEPSEDTLQLCIKILEMWVNADSKRDIEILDWGIGSELKKCIHLIERPD